jgi:hypothetical protein
MSSSYSNSGHEVRPINGLFSDSQVYPSDITVWIINQARGLKVNLLMAPRQGDILVFVLFPVHGLMFVQISPGTQGQNKD